MMSTPKMMPPMYVQPAAKEPTYADYIAKRNDPYLVNLVDYLRSDISRWGLTRPPSVKDTLLRIIDHVGTHLSVREVNIPVEGAVTQDFKDFLCQEPPPDTKARFFLWSTRSINTMNERYVDYIANTLDLDPYFLSAHLEKTLHWFPIYHTAFKSPLPTERTHLQIVRDRDEFVTFSQTTLNNIPIVFAISQQVLNGKLNYLGGRLRAGARPVTLQRLANNPMDILALYMHDYLQSAASDIPQLWSLGNASFPSNIEHYHINEKRTHSNWSVASEWRQNLTAFQHELVLYQNTKPDPKKLSQEGYDTLKTNLDFLLQQVQVFADSSQAKATMMAAAESVDLARQSAEEAVSMRRLALAATIFLPLNFAASFLSMNLSTSYFLQVMMVVTMISSLLLSGAWSFERAWNQSRKEWAHSQNIWDYRDVRNVGLIVVARAFVKDRIGDLRRMAQRLKTFVKGPAPKEHPA